MIDTAFLKTCTKLYAGFSGGLDSTVLLHLLAAQAELLPPIEAIYIHHGMSPNASAWQAHCEQVCKTFNIPLITRAVEFNRFVNVEEAARKARYAVFAEYIVPKTALLTGHHADDQAETLLLQLLRGAGVDGIAAMKDRVSFASGMHVRPLLDIPRKQLECYAKEHQLSWIDDESNLDQKYARNYLRHTILPLLQEKWPGAINTLSRASRLAQDAKVCLDDLAKADTDISIPHRLPVAQLKNLSGERIRNALRFFIKQQGIKLPSAATLKRIDTEVIKASADATAEVVWADYRVRLYDDMLYLDRLEQSIKPAIIPWPNFPESFNPGYGLGLFEGKGTAQSVEIRFRQGGEVVSWHGQTKSLKKLFQQWKIPPWDRDNVPLIFVQNKLAVVVGYAISDDFPGVYVSRYSLNGVSLSSFPSSRA